MKKWTVFALLKVADVAAVVFAPYWLGRWAFAVGMIERVSDGVFYTWMAGWYALIGVLSMTAIALSILALVWFGAPHWFRANARLADWLTGGAK